MSYRRFQQIYIPLAGIGIAALWPLTAYAFNPLLLPSALVVVIAAVVVLRWPEYGLAIAIASTALVGVKLPQAATVGITLPAEPFRILVTLMIFGVLIYGFMVYGVNPRRLPATFWGIGLVVGASVLSAFHGIDPARSIVDVVLLVTAAALFLAIHNICRTRDQLLVVVGGALAALLIASVHGIVQHFAGVFSTQGFLDNSGESVGRVQGSFGHPNEYGSFLAMLMPLAVAVAATKKSPSGLRVLGATAAIASVLAINYSYSRGAIVTLLLGSLLWLLILRPKLAIITVIVVGLGVLAIAPGVLKQRLDPQATGSDIELRRDVAQGALDIYSQHPLLGVGLNNFQAAYAQGTPLQTAPQKRLFHNDQLLVPTAAPGQYLNTLVEQGLIGLTALVALYLITLATAYQRCKSRDPTVRGIALGVGTGISAFVLYSFLDPLLQEVTVLMLFTMLALVGEAESALRRPEEEPAPEDATVPGGRRHVAVA